MGNLKLNFSARSKIIFWITFGILLLFTLTPRGYAQALDSGAENSSASTAASAPENSAETPPQTFPYKKQFVISGYYSPLPGQSIYVRGSYEADIILNGGGVHGADGTLVYPGMAAAPSTFPFGTKMLIPGFGTVAVHDRGGAIKNNRLDLWLGSGEEGLRRALGWGMRTVEVTVYGIDLTIQESVNFTDIPLATLQSRGGGGIQTKYFHDDLAFGDDGIAVSELQRFLKKTGFMSAEASGYFDDATKEAVQKFQLAANVITDSNDTGAGNFGPKSRVAFESLLDQKKEDALKNLPDSKDDAKNMQEVLVRFGFLKEANGTFDAATKDALVKMQIDVGLIEKPKDTGAGFYGPKTRAALAQFITIYFTPDAQNTFASESLAFKDSGTTVELLQDQLKRLNFLGVSPTGYFGKTTEHAVLKFQQAFSIIEDEKSDGAGVVGPKTLAALNELSQNRHDELRLIATTTNQKNVVAARLKNENVLVAGVTDSTTFQNDLNYGSRGNDVQRLQTVLKRLGFFPGRLATEYFGDITKQSLAAFQKSHGLSESGTFDEATRRTVNKIIQPQILS